MWLSKKLSVCQATEQEGAATDMGVTTIGGASASVMTRGEQRNLEVFAPGGLVWQPRAGDTVLVVKGGSGCQEACVVAAETAGNAPEDMAPGELYLYSSGGASLHLRSDGSIAVSGPVEMEGKLSVQGDVKITGRVDIFGALYVNGVLFRSCSCG